MKFPKLGLGEGVKRRAEKEKKKRREEQERLAHALREFQKYCPVVAGNLKKTRPELFYVPEPDIEDTYLTREEAERELKSLVEEVVAKRGNGMGDFRKIWGEDDPDFPVEHKERLPEGTPRFAVGVVVEGGAR